MYESKGGETPQEANLFKEMFQRERGTSIIIISWTKPKIVQNDFTGMKVWRRGNVHGFCCTPLPTWSYLCNKSLCWAVVDNATEYFNMTWAMPLVRWQSQCRKELRPPGLTPGLRLVCHRLTQAWHLNPKVEPSCGEDTWFKDSTTTFPLPMSDINSLRTPMKLSNICISKHKKKEATDAPIAIGSELWENCKWKVL